MAVRRVPILVLLLVGFLASPGAALAQAPAGGPKDETATAPVEVDGVVLFRVLGASSYPAETRAQAIRDRLVAVAADPSIPVDALRVTERQDTQVIVAGDQPIMAVLEADASLEQVNPLELATAHLMRMRTAVQAYRDARSASALRGSAINTLIATAVFLVVLVGVFWAWRGVEARLRRYLEARIQTVGIQSFEVMRADRIVAMVRSALKGVRSMVLLTVLLIYVGYVLARWPLTHGFSQDLKGFVFRPIQVLGGGLVAHIPALIFLLVLYVIVRVLLRLIRLFFDAVEQGGVKLAEFDPEWATPTYRIVRIAVVAFALIVAYPYIPGSESDAFKGVSIFIGVLFSLGSSTAISNMVAGYMLTYRRAFKVGDRVKIGDTVGDVLKVRLQVTHLRTVKNEEVVVPNAEILSSEVMNYSSIGRAEGLILHTEVGIGYETPWRQVEAMLIGAAQRTPGLAAAPPPFVILKKLGDFAVTYELNAYCTDVSRMARLYSAMHRSVLDVFNEFGVQIMTPAYEGDPEKPKVVPPAEWYTAPAHKSDETARATAEVART